MNDNENSKFDLITIIAIFAVVAGLGYFGWLAIKDNMGVFALFMSKTSLVVLDTLHGWGSVGYVIILGMFGSEYTDPNSIKTLTGIYERIDIHNMSNNEIFLHLEFGSFVLQWCVILIVVPLLIRLVWVKNRVQRMTKVHNLVSLYAKLADVYPHLKPPLEQNLLYKDPDVGLYAREASPIRYAIQKEFIRAYGIKRPDRITLNSRIVTFDKRKRNTHLVIRDNLTKEISKLHNRCEILPNRLRNTLTKQLGEKFTGVENLPLHMRAMLACFIEFAKGKQGKKNAFALFEQYNRTWDWSAVHDENENLHPTFGQYINTTGIDQILKPFEGDLALHKDQSSDFSDGINNDDELDDGGSLDIYGFDHNHQTEKPSNDDEIDEGEVEINDYHFEEVVKVLTSHAYQYTMMHGMLEYARTKGKLWPSLWFWLMPLDRTLYWTLDSAGGQTYFTECAAVGSHYIAETTKKVALYQPRVNPAIKAITKMLDDDEGWVLNKVRKEELEALREQSS